MHAWLVLPRFLIDVGKKKKPQFIDARFLKLSHLLVNNKFSHTVLNKWKDKDKERKKSLKNVSYNISFVNIFINLTERFTEIERENRILLEKMSNIMQNPKPSLYNPSKLLFHTKNIMKMFLIYFHISDIKIKPSLNRDQRRRDLIKITVEN